MSNNKERNKLQSISIAPEPGDAVLAMLRDTYKSSPGDTGAALRLAQYYVDRGWYNQAMDIFRDSLKENGDDYTMLLEYGNTCFKKGDYSEAGITFKKLTEIKPDKIEGWNNLGIVQIHEGDLDASYTSFSKVIEIEPDNAGALVNMGNYHTGKGEYDSSITFFKKAVEVSPSFADAWYNLGNSLLVEKNFEKAIEAFEKALKYKGEFPSALKNLGFVYEKLGRFIDAERSYTLAIEFNKADATLRSNLGAVLIELNKVDQAKECFLKAVRLAPQEMSGWMGLRQVALIRGDLQTFTRATLAILPRLNEAVIAQSVEVLNDLDQASIAEEIVKQADRLGKNGALLDMQRALVYFRLEGMSERVALLYKKILAIDNPNNTQLKGLARFAFLSGDFENVITYVNKMDQLDFSTHSIFWRSLISLSRDAQARRLIQNHIREYPECFECWFLLAEIESKRGHRLRAEKFLIRALENGFTNMEELNQNPVLKEIFESLSQNSTLVEGLISSDVSTGIHGDRERR